jgi:hypothetical protein
MAPESDRPTELGRSMLDKPFKAQERVAEWVSFGIG